MIEAKRKKFVFLFDKLELIWFNGCTLNEQPTLKGSLMFYRDLKPPRSFRQYRYINGTPETIRPGRIPKQVKTNENEKS